MTYVTGLAPAVCCLLGLASSLLAAEAPPREDLGRSVKLRILVDKVMQPEEGWVSKEWMIKEAADAGFNVFSPRRGHDRIEEVIQVTDWCAKYGLYHMPWMRGTLEAPPGAASDGKRMVWAAGNEQTLWSPNADEFWEWTTRYIVEYAKISRDNKHLMGVFLDYENYSPNGSGNCYDLSYDSLILGKFTEAKGLTLPELAPKERKPWLEQQGLHEAFEQFQIAHWRERCRALRKAVDEYDPTFQFCIYPAPGTKFMVEACYPEWSTQQAPLILADPWTYGRPSRLLPQKEALEANLATLQRGMKVPQEAGIPFIYAGGIDPVVTGADPEFCGKNAVMISEVTDGYWIFYEGPQYKKDHPEYFKWFTWANKAIAEGRFAAWHEPRENPENWALGIFGDTRQPAELALPPVTGQTVEYPPTTLRGDNLILVAARAGQPVQIRLKNVPVARYQSLLVWELRDPSLEKIAGGTIPHGQEGVVSFTPTAEGVYLLGASSGSCAYSILSSNAPLGLHAGQKLGLIYATKRLYFHVPAGMSQFKLAIRGSGAETVRLNVYDATGNQVASGQTTPQQNTAEVLADVGDQADRTWSLELVKADEGVLEDSSLTLDPKLSPVLSLAPEQVFALRR